MTEDLEFTVEKGHGGVYLVQLTDRDGETFFGDGLTVKTALRNAERQRARWQHARACEKKAATDASA